MKAFNQGANPYMPLWEHVPDGEPRVFTYKGEKRVYVYGSHDTLKTEYCGKDQVVWSAPVEDLTAFRYEGVCYEATDKSILYAPDVVQKGDTFYLYAAEQRGSRIMVAKSKHPAGPFTDPVVTELGFDPGVLVDDDGRVYAYWGFCRSYCAELNEDMATIKPGTLKHDPIGHCINVFGEEDFEHVDETFGFFEASSPRKIGNKYVYVYSKRYDQPIPALGLDEPCNGFLSYAYSDSPLGPWTFGGDIIFNGGEIIPHEDGTGTMTYRWGNNHGGLVQVEDQWYIFYHRHTDTTEFARQGMIEPVEVAISQEGKVYIGAIAYNEKGNPISQKPVEMTSQGAHLQGLDAYKWTQAASTCFLYGGSKTAYIQAVYEKRDEISAPIVAITSGLTVGFRYIQFGSQPPKKICLTVQALQDLVIRVHIDHYQGEVIGETKMVYKETEVECELTQEVIGKHALYITFYSLSQESIATFDKFIFY